MVTLSTSSSYLPIQAQNPEDTWLNQFYETHRDSYEKFDFASPMLDLFAHASCFKGVTLRQKKAWILASHEKSILRAAYTDPLQEEMALACGSSLLETLHNFLERESLFTRDSLAFYKYFCLNEDFKVDIEKFTETLFEKMKDTLKRKDPVPMFDVIYWMQFHYYRSETINGLAEAVIHQAFEGDPPEKALFRQLIPFIFDAFKAAANSYITLSPYCAPSSKDCCIII